MEKTNESQYRIFYPSESPVRWFKNQTSKLARHRNINVTLLSTMSLLTYLQWIIRFFCFCTVVLSFTSHIFCRIIKFVCKPFFGCFELNKAWLFVCRCYNIRKGSKFKHVNLGTLMSLNENLPSYKTTKRPLSCAPFLTYQKGIPLELLSKHSSRESFFIFNSALWNETWRGHMRKQKSVWAIFNWNNDKLETNNKQCTKVLKFQLTLCLMHDFRFNIMIYERWESCWS